MKLKELRMKYNYTQKEIAKKLNTNSVNYNRYELEKVKPDIETLKKLSKLYHVSIDTLVDNEETNQIDVGLLSQEEIEILEITKQLTKRNQERLLSHAMALIETQEDEQIIIKKIKGNR